MIDKRRIFILDGEKAGNLCVFFALILAYFARSILAKILFGTISLPVFYVLAYGSVLVSIWLRFRRINSYLPWLIAIGTVILFGMNRTGDFSPLYSYLLVILLPLVVPDHILSSKNWVVFVFTVTTFVAIGCIIGRLFPSVYRALVLPLFKENDFRMITYVLNAVEGAQGGFVSQSGYASYFLCIGIGALYCFRNHFKTKMIVFLFVLFFIGLLFTQKRSPLVMFVIAILFVYYSDGHGSERFKRFFYIVLVLLGIYIILSILVASGTKITVIEKVYEVIHGLISGSEINDTGRTQLYGQAVIYFLGNPLTGIGWLNFKNLFLLRKTHVHDIYLQLLCETGIIGFSVFISFFIANIVRTCRMIRELSTQRNDLALCWCNFSLYIQAFFLLFGITENPLYDTENVMFYFLAVGISIVASSIIKANNDAVID